MDGVGLIIFSPTLVLHHYSCTGSMDLLFIFPNVRKLKFTHPLKKPDGNNNNDHEWMMTHLGTKQQK